MRPKHRSAPFQNPSLSVLSKAKSLSRKRGSAVEEAVREILKVHIAAASSQNKDVSGIVDACFEKLKLGGYLKLDDVMKPNSELLSNGTACEVE